MKSTKWLKKQKKQENLIHWEKLLKIKLFNKLFPFILLE